MKHQDIIAGFVHNDKQIILYLYKKLFHQVKKMVLESGGDEDDIRNTIWKAFNAFKVQCQKDAQKIRNTEAYVVQTARLLWYQELKKKIQKKMIHQYYEEIEEEVELVESIEASFIETDRQEIALQFQQYLDNISFSCQQIIRLRYQYNLPHSDIATRYETSEAASRKRLSRCLKELARFIDSKGLTEQIANHFPSVVQYVRKYVT